MQYKCQNIIHICLDFQVVLFGGKYADVKKQAIPLLEQNDILYVDWNSLTGDSE